MQGKLVILRGIPGSGKSTLAKKLKKEAKEKAKEKDYIVGICSADNYFMRPDGVYDFNPKLLKNAHQWCQAQARDCMAPLDDDFGEDWANDPSIIDTDLVIIDNTNIKKQHYQIYLDMAEEYGYDVEEIVVGLFDEKSVRQYAERNAHGVPVEKVLQMAKNFEK